MSFFYVGKFVGLVTAKAIADVVVIIAVTISAVMEGARTNSGWSAIIRAAVRAGTIAEWSIADLITGLAPAAAITTITIGESCIANAVVGIHIAVAIKIGRKTRVADRTTNRSCLCSTASHHW